MVKLFGLNYTLIPKKNIGIGFLVFLIQIWLYINASTVYGQFASIAKETLLIYILMLLGSITITGARPDILNADIGRAYNFALMFFISALVLVLVPVVTSGLTLSNQSGLGTLLLQVFAVAYTEEIFFRGVLQDQLGALWSNGIFSIFHWAVYGGNLPVLLFLFILGNVFSQIKRYTGISGAIGAHAAWNLKSLGVLDKFIKGTPI